MLRDHNDRVLFNELPQYVQGKIFEKFLYVEFLSQFRRLFRLRLRSYRTTKSNSKIENEKHRVE